MKIDFEQLERELGIPVFATVATEGTGMDILKGRLAGYGKKAARSIKYDEALESAIQRIEGILPGEYGLSKRAIALLLLQEDPGITALVNGQIKDDCKRLEKMVEETKKSYGQPLNYIINFGQAEGSKQNRWESDHLFR